MITTTLVELALDLSFFFLIEIRLIIRHTITNIKRSYGKITYSFFFCVGLVPCNDILFVI